MKKLILLFLMFLPLMASAVVIDGIYYNLYSSSDGIKTAEVTSPGRHSYYYYSDIVIPESVTYEEDIYNITSIGNEAFSGSSSLTSVTIPNSVTSIGSSAFSGCSGLTSITIPNSVTSIGSNAFYGTAWYDSQPDGIVFAGKVFYKFKGDMPEGTNIDIEEGTLGIAGGAFYDCSGLTSITIPNCVTNIGEIAFYGCSGLTSITIPNSVTNIGESAFSGCSGLTSITIPNSVTSIEWYAFSGCSGLTSITIPNSVTSIGSGAFNYCSGLTSITIGNSVTSIGKSAFYYCSGLISVTIPNSVTNIGESAFSGCSSLTSISIPDGVTSIGNDVFSGCSSLTSISIPDGVTSIGNNVFSGCSSLTSISIPDGVTSIGNGVFSGCWNLTSITIPNSVTSIGIYAYQNCGSLTSISIPDGVTSIGDGTFSGCRNLTSITIPNSVTSIGKEGFYNCRSLTSVVIPNSVSSIAESAFSNCGFVEVTLPSNLQIIKSGTFSSCGNLEYIIIPASVEYIYQNAFSGCYSLKSVKSIAEAPPFLYDNSFSNYDIPLYVPEASIDSYKAKDGWKNFKDILSIDAAKFTLTYMVDGEVYKTYEVYEGTTIVPEAEPTKDGYEFSGWSTIPSTMPAEDVTITGTFKVQADEDVIKITSVGQTTWCSAYDLDFTDIEGLKAYIASGYHRTKGTIWLTRVKEVPAGEGILLIGDEGEYKVPHKSTTAYYANLMVGTVKSITINETDGEYTNYYLSNGASGVGFYKVNGSVDIKANRAYLPLLKNTVSGSRGFIGMDFDDDEDGTTGISEAQQRVGKQDVYYNLQGQRVDNPTKGIYIKNGKMVVIK